MHVAFPTRQVAAPCPACGAAANAVYSVRGIPTQSCVLLDDRAAALGFPRGDLELAVCRGCGFLFNSAFDPALVDYREGYEETQGCSGTFRTWLDELARELVDRAGLRSLPASTIVEVGCGRGDFLEALARRAGARGIGIDPSRTAGRVDRTAGRGLEFRHEPWGAAHDALGADLIVCRHTLEHLPDVRSFALRLAEAVRSRPGAACMLEVPDTLRILHEGAFWDVYYEHCSYFTLDSLARLVRAAGIEVDEGRLSFGDQYIQLFGRAGRPGAVRSTDGAAASVESVLHACDAFRETTRQTLAAWSERLAACRTKGETVVLWGSGSKATGFLVTLDAGDACRAVVDINPARHGKFVAGTGHPIVAPERLRELRPDQVVVMNPVYLEEITADLARMGLEPIVSALGA